MTIAIGFDQASGSLVIVGNGVFPARTLLLSISPLMPDHIQIGSLSGRSEQSVPWSDVTSLDGSYTPQSMADALAYLQGEFAKGPSMRPIPAPYPLNGAASFAIAHGLSYPPSATILDPNGVEVDTDVSHTPGLTTLMFASPFTGTVYLG